jgi:5S rRNA maturation endonuclease (ribonuclease M5)
MAPENQRRHTIDVDRLQTELTVRQVANYFGFALPEGFSDAGEQRMRCPCTSCTGHADDHSVSINTSDPFKRWKCHREGYGCGASGNLVNLAYCLKHGSMPAGGKPTGKDFYATAQDLEAIAGGKSPPADAAPRQDPTAVREFVRKGVAATIVDVPASAVTVSADVKANVPLSQSENENARNLVTLDQQLSFALDDLSSPASSYARRRPFLLSEAIARECRCGYMPGSSKSSLRGQWVFGVQNEQGEALAWVGRNVKYDAEREEWFAGGRRDKEPLKYRFPTQALFRRGLELYGQEFLGNERFAESLKRYGVVLVEGFTDRLRLHELGVMSLAMMSNKITDQQSERLARYAEQYGGGRVGVMHDADGPGDDGAKETLWRMHEQGIDAYLVWSRRKFAGKFDGRQPESLATEEWDDIAESITSR